MFTGIIETTGKLLERSRGRLLIKPKKGFAALKIGESICVDGVCLTVEEQTRAGILFRLLPETLRVTTLGRLKPGQTVNLERALRFGDRLGGHLLWGHVDGQAAVLKREPRGSSLTLTFQVLKELAAGFVPKGPIALDGVSLTLDSVPGTKSVPGTDVRFQVHLVAHTLAATTLGSKAKGDRLNLELDPIAKYLRGML